MLVKLFECPSSQYRFKIFRLDRNTNGKEVSLLPKVGRDSLHIRLSLFRLRRLFMKKKPHWSLLLVFRLSKNENTIEHLPSWAHEKSTRSYHIELTSIPSSWSLNYEEGPKGVSWCHHIWYHIMEASPHWVAFVQIILQWVFLRSPGYH